jgi:hypothetical protein
LIPVIKSWGCKNENGSSFVFGYKQPVFWLHADSVTITNADIAGGSNEVDRLIPALKNYYALQQFDKAEKLCLHILELNLPLEDSGISWNYLYHRTQL